jgi:hypothetical protein
MCGHQLPPFEIYAITMETLLVTFTLEIFDSMASGKQTDVAVMDFSKAFDKVDHQSLILKLKCMGINNKTWTEPWGMPDNTGQLFDVWPSTTTL